VTNLGGKTLCVAAFMALGLSSSALWAQNSLSQSPIIPFNNSDTLSPIYQDGQVLLHWTAPGDDANIGRAAGYDLRYVPSSAGPIDTEAKWNQAVQVQGEPVPSQAGQRDSMVVARLAPCMSYYFCIKTVDDANNWSLRSNSPLLSANRPINAFSVGDINNSGDVNGLDLIYLVQALKGKAVIQSPDLRGDVNGNCAIDGLDVVYLRAFLNGGASLQKSQCAGDSLELAKVHLKANTSGVSN
jgi:hypothetical protein